MTKKIILSLLLLLSTLSGAFAEGISTKLSSRAVALNESFSITFSSPQNVQEPDFSPLLADFDILSSNRGQNISIINGQVAQEVSWNLALMPKHEGDLIIPSIHFGPFSSEPTTIEVISSRAPKSDEALFVEIETHPSSSIYAQTQLIITVRLYTTHKITQATLSNLKTNDPDAIIERLGSDTQYEQYHANGKFYIVFERKYAVFPQHAGKLVIDPVAFEGKVILGGRSFFDVQSQFKRAASEQLTIDVKPIPAPFTKNNWFAANAVQFVEEWSADPNTMTVGEPLTWTLTLKAEGCLGNQIPTPSFHFPSEIKYYLDKTETSNQPGPEGFSGFKQIKVALIATKPGEVVLPEISLDWWDLKANEVRHLQLPARTIRVIGGQVAMNEDLPTTDPIIPVQTKRTSTEAVQTLPLWGWGVLGLSIFALISLLSVLHRRSSNKPDSLKRLKLEVKKACKSNDPKQAEAALLAWAGYLYPAMKPLNMTRIKQELPEDLQKAMDALYEALYSRRGSWNGKALWEAFSAFKPKKGAERYSRVKQENLRELYPNG